MEIEQILKWKITGSINLNKKLLPGKVLVLMAFGLAADLFEQTGAC